MEREKKNASKQKHLTLTNGLESKRGERGGGVSGIQVQWDTHTSRWESDAQETTTDTRMCDVEYTKRQELEGVGPRWFDARHAVGTIGLEMPWEM